MGVKNITVRVSEDTHKKWKDKKDSFTWEEVLRAGIKSIENRKELD